MNQALLAFALTALSVAALRPIAVRLGAVSRIRGDRWHTDAVVPRLSGPGIFLGVAVAVDYVTALALGLFCAVGVLDDLRELTPLVKAALLGVASIAAGVLLGSFLVAVAAWVVANAVNLLDHADGVAGGTVAASVFMSGEATGTAAAAAVLGFLMFNLPSARAFMGDGGSLMLGALLVMVWHDGGLGAVALGSAVPLLEAGFVTVRRIASHRPPWVGGTDHTGHVLLRAGVPSSVLPLVYAAVAAGAVAWGRGV